MITYEALGDIYSVSKEAIKLAIEKCDSVEFDFNGIKIRVVPESYCMDIVKIYNLEHELRIAKKKLRIQ